MAARCEQWSGTSMLIGQPAEKRVGGASAMMKDRLWARFGRPDYALAFHVSFDVEAGKIVAIEGSTYSGADTVASSAAWAPTAPFRIEAMTR